MIIAFNTCIRFKLRLHIRRFQRPGLSDDLGNDLVVILRRPLLGAFGVGGAVEHEGVHGSCDVAGAGFGFGEAHGGGAVHPGGDVFEGDGAGRGEEGEGFGD